MNESQIQQQIRIACSLPDVRLWRNNVGVIKDQHGRPVRFGLCVGSSDLIGYVKRKITPDMVGQEVAVFAAVEVKGPRTPITDAQTNFINHIRDAGGIAGVARSVEDALDIVNNP